MRRPILTLALISLIGEVRLPALAAETVGNAPGAADTHGRWSLRLAVEQAIEAHPRVRALAAQIHASEERIPQAGALPDPMFSYRFEGMPRGDEHLSLPDEQRFMISQMLPAPGKRGAMKSMAQADADARRWELAALRNDIAAEVVTAFNELHLVNVRLAELEESQAALRLLADLTRTRYEVGSSGQDDYLRATMELSEATARGATERAKLDAATARLNLLLERDPDSILVVPDWQPAPAPPLGTQDLRARALEGSPLLRARESEAVRSESGIRLAGKEAWPDVTVGLGVLSMEDMGEGWMGEVSLNLPIWRGSRVAPRQRQAEAELAAALEDRRAVHHELYHAVENAWVRFEAADIQVARYRDAVLSQADLAVASNRSAYESGRGDLTRLIESVRARLRYRLENEEAVVERENAIAELARLVGDMTLVWGDTHD